MPSPAAFSQDAFPSISITKDDGGISVDEGTGFAYTLEFENTGDTAFTAVTITDTVPDDTTFDSTNDSEGWTCTPDASAGSTCTLDVGPLGTDETGTVQFSLIVDELWEPDPSTELCPTEPVDPQIENTATISGDTGSGSVGDGSSDTTPVNVFCEAFLLSINKAAFNSPEPGEDLNYALAFSNEGNVDLDSVTITETVPELTTFNPDGTDASLWDCDGTAAGSTCIHEVGPMAADSGGLLFFPLTVDEFDLVEDDETGCESFDIPEDATIDNTVTISTTTVTKRAGSKSQESSDSDSTPIQLVGFACDPAMQISVTQDTQSIPPGGSVTLDITILGGEQPLTNLQVVPPVGPPCDHGIFEIPARAMIEFECVISNIQSSFSGPLMISAELPSGDAVTRQSLITATVMHPPIIPIGSPYGLALLAVLMAWLGCFRIRWQLTGDGSEVRDILASDPGT